ncbi:ADP-ribosylation factor family-domain-containing protein [Podospora aff. communis PSN243]|uniref:ADP-ribosylation factor family-domain-containing protein n=1 Tax=Podospora aff. communis PSN243 TaxID=3040156 RepID=A0AAV9GQE5_9PEZI|nr:ADP-ribosylation factor family-domain-containing protein [Podospora aff. communis PSN243]
MSSILSAAIQTVQTLLATRPKRVNLLVTGLDNAGKTTLLHRMRNSDPNCDSTLASSTDIHLTSCAPDGAQRKLILNAVDLGALQYRHHPGGIHKLWRDFLEGGSVGGAVFVVDAADTERLHASGKLLQGLLGVMNEVEMQRTTGNSSIPVLVLGNKIDDHRAVSENEIREALGLGSSRAQERAETRPLKLFMCSTVMRQGYLEGFDWLSSYLISN